MFDQLIEENEGLMYRVLHKYHLADDPDAIGLAYDALYSAIRTHDGSIAKLSTYATVCVTNAVFGLMRSRAAAAKTDPVHYNVTVSDSDLTLLDLLATKTLEEEYNEKEGYERLVGIINRIMTSRLTINEKNVLQSWLSSGCKKKTTDLSKEVGISQSQVSFILATFRAKVRRAYEQL